MSLWFFVIAVQITQELATASIVFVQAVQQHLNLWIIHAIFVAGTVLDIFLGHAMGVWVRRRFTGSWLNRFVEARIGRVERAIGHRGVKLVLIVLGFVNYIWLDAFLCAWLESVPRRSMYIYLTIGDALQYALMWTVLLGLISVTQSLTFILLGVLAVAGGIAVLVERREMR